MSYSHLLNDPSSKDDVSVEDLERVLTQVLEDIFLIYPDEMEGIAPEVVGEASENIRAYFGDIRHNLSSQAKTHDIFQLAEKISHLDKEPFLNSEKLNVTGIPYRLVEIDGSFIPVVIKTGSVPENGVWVSDRLHLTSFAMLAEDINSSTVRFGFILYARSGLFRKVSIHSTDRRQVLQAISRVRKIKEGTMPDKKESSLCNSCSYSEMCNVKASFASKFF